MKPFLYRVAELFYNEYQADIQKFHFVFPNKRAGIFFQKYLTDIIDKPIFSPQIITISDCFEQSTDWQLIDKTDALFRLFDIYKKLSKSEEGFDTFIFWAEQLLADFNEVDKYLVEPKQIFTNLLSLNELNNIDYLTDEQKTAIERFWNIFIVENQTETKKEFVALWRLLLPIYKEFQKSLKKENLATDGMIFREVVTALKNGKKIPFFTDKQFVFVGFNALTEAENQFFKELNKRGIADFYWDYEADELRDKDNPASKFYLENSKNFPSKLELKSSVIPLKNREIELISIPSDIGQTKEIFRLLSQKVGNDEQTFKTAVVLPNENLLRPMLSSIPENIQNINITMGLPLKQTPIADLMENIFELHIKKNRSNYFYHHSVYNILNQAYVSQFCPKDIEKLQKEIIEKNLIYISASKFENYPLLNDIFISELSSANFIDYLLKIVQSLYRFWKQEECVSEERKMDLDYLYSYEKVLNRLNDLLLNKNYKQVEIPTLIRIIKQLVGGVNIPFEGEPLNGLQIMGMLETRIIDFDRLIISSFNEGVFPKSNFNNSFIPHQLRVAFGLQTTEFYEAVQSYNFYRLISRTKEIYFLFDSRNDEMKIGDISRYGKQLQYCYGVEMKKRYLSYEVKASDDEPIVIEKTGEVMAKLKQFLEGGNWALSASAINTYLDCPLKFYYNYVEKLDEPDELSETIEADIFGSIIHKILENIYNRFVGKVVDSQMLDEVINNKELIEKETVRVFNELYYHNEKPTMIELDGYVYLISEIIQKYIEKVLIQDKKQTPFTYLFSEKAIKTTFPIQNGTQKVNIKGFIDRVDRKDGILRIIDYKSGNGKDKASSLASAFDRELGRNRPSFILQTFLYCLLYEMENPEIKEKLKPAIYYIRKVYDENFKIDVAIGEYRKSVVVDDFSVYKEEYTELLTEVLDEIFNENIPFAQCDKGDDCPFCSTK